MAMELYSRCAHAAAAAILILRMFFFAVRII